MPDMDGDKPKKQRFKRYPIGFFHIDIAELRTAEGKLYLFVTIDRISKFAVAQLVERADRKTAWEFLELLLEAVPYCIHTILTDNHCPAGDCEAICREEASSSRSSRATGTSSSRSRCAST